MDAESLEMLARSSCTAHPQSFGGAPAESSCKHEHSHIVDSKTHGGGYAGPVSRRIFCSWGCAVAKRPLRMRGCVVA
ncbi:hypothetical protein ACLBVR_31885, partial [Pseudomonas aeruginosa]